MNSFKKISVLALLFATVYSAPSIKQRLGQVKETKLAQVEAAVEGAGCGCGCPCDVDFPEIPVSEQPNGGELGSVTLANTQTNVNYNVGEEFIPTTTTRTRSAAESCVHSTTSGREGACGVRTRHFDISGGICVNEWIDSCEIEAGWEQTTGCSARAQTCVSGLADDAEVDLGDAPPTCLSVTVAQATCGCDEVVGGGTCGGAAGKA